VLLSKTHARKLVDFPNSTWTVDRTSRWGHAGALLRSLQLGNPPENFNDLFFSDIGGFNCEQINNPHDLQRADEFIWGLGKASINPAFSLFSRPQEPLPEEPYSRVNYADELLFNCPDDIDLATGTLLRFGSPLWSARDKWCAKQYMDWTMSTRCPQYGAAVSGICQTAYTMVMVNCGPFAQADIHAAAFTVEDFNNAGPFFISNIIPQSNPVNNKWPSPQENWGPLAGYHVVDDSTPFCLQANPLQMSGEAEHLLGFDHSVDEMNNFYGDHFVTFGCLAGNFILGGE